MILIFGRHSKVFEEVFFGKKVAGGRFQSLCRSFQQQQNANHCVEMYLQKPKPNKTCGNCHDKEYEQQRINGEEKWVRVILWFSMGPLARN